MKAANATVGTRYLRLHWTDIEQEFTSQFLVDGFRFEAPKTADGRNYLVHLNYHCHGAYGPAQMVEFLGYLVTVWAKEGMESAHESIERAEDLDATIERLGAKADGMCHHPHAVRTGYANCYTEYHCPDCGANYGVDSSG